MSHPLKRHPDTPCDAVANIMVEVARRGGALSLSYQLTGRVRDVYVPPLGASLRTDELWRRTCFEAFVQAPPASSYGEFNFAPSTAWAAYRFSAYRQGMTDALETPVPRVELTRLDEGGLTLHAAVEAALLSHVRADAPWRLALSAVIEEANGRVSYWALAHPQGKADFHHADCFALELPPASRAT